MAELMNEHEQKLYENLMAHNSAYYGYKLSKGEIKTILQAFTELKRHRATTEAEIRAKAIDEFAEKLKEAFAKATIGFDAKFGKVLYAHEDGTWHDLTEDLAEQLKGE